MSSGNGAFLSAAMALLRSGWTLMTSVHYPGTNISIAVITVGAFFVVFSIRVLTWALTRRLSVGGSMRTMRRFDSSRGNGKDK